MKLLSDLRERHRARVRAKSETLAEIARRAAKGKHTEADLATIESMELDPGELTERVDRLNRIEAARAIVATGPELRAAHKEARAEQKAHGDETKRINAERLAKGRELDAAASKASNALKRVHEAELELLHLEPEDVKEARRVLGAAEHQARLAESALGKTEGLLRNAERNAKPGFRNIRGKALDREQCDEWIAGETERRDKAAAELADANKAVEDASEHLQSCLEEVTE